jgi:phosphohistidine phosphatase SixA
MLVESRPVNNKQNNMTIKRVMMWLMLMMVSISQATTFYVLRHAEKADDGSKDPVLTEQGQQRAINLAGMLAGAGIEKVYASNYQRTQLTARPLAELLGIEVSSYDPADLPGLKERLLSEGVNAMIVGHSNTTPMLAHLLSGQAVSNLDEANFDFVFQVIRDGDQAQVNTLRSAPTQAAAALTDWQPLSDRWFSGSLTFNMQLNGQVVGQSVHSFNESDGHYQLHEKTTIEAYNIDADINAVVAPANLAPQSLTMTGAMGQPVSIDLAWQGQQVSGHSQMAREPFKPQGKLDISESLRPGTTERTSLIMLAHLLPVSAEQSLLTNWFNGYDGEQRLINISFKGEEQVTVPAGTFDTYKIEYAGGAPSQYYWIDKQQPKVVKIEVIKSPWSYELVSAEQK